MFKAVNRESNEEIIILDPRWIDRVDYLRQLDKQDILVCQECRQPVRVRAGEIRIQHFAHKHLQNCPYGYESPALMRARMVLYRWLYSKFEDGVTLEKRLENTSLPRCIDCWVERGSARIAYWIIDARMGPQKRETLKAGMARTKARANWVVVADMLREDEHTPGRVNLSTTEREFMHRSEYDEVEEGWRHGMGRSLHYLDYENEALITFRGLHLVHSPQMYEGNKKGCELALVLVSPKTGEFVHPGEHEMLREYREKQQEQAVAEKERPQELQGIARFIGLPGEVVPGAPRAVPAHVPHLVQEEGVGLAHWVKPEATCRICGKKTSEWVVHYAVDNTCECRECSRKRASEA